MHHLFPSLPYHAMPEAHTYNCIVTDSEVCTDIVDGYDVVGEWVPCGSVVTVADGTEGGTVPLTVAKSGNDLTVFWDATTPGRICAACAVV